MDFILLFIKKSKTFIYFIYLLYDQIFFEIEEDYGISLETLCKSLEERGIFMMLESQIRSILQFLKRKRKKKKSSFHYIRSEFVITLLAFG